MVLLKGWQKVGNTWYYLKSNGAMSTGWQKVGNAWYYLKSNGAMSTGWQKVGNTWYYLKSNGAMSVGWQKVGNTWYYLKGNGAMSVGWQKVGNTWYYLKSNGAMVANTTQRINGTLYSFDASGKMQENVRLATTGKTKNIATGYQDVEERLVALINQLRASKGLIPLKQNKTLVQAAQIRANENKTKFSHTRPNGQICTTILKEVGIGNFSYYGENIASYTSNRNYSHEEMAQKLFKQWVNSPLHYENMIKANYREVGFGVTKNGNSVFATTQFLTK